MFREWIAVTAAFSLLTGLLTYPQLFHLSTHVGYHYDALFSIWRLAWIAHQVPRDPLRLFDANIFHPEPATLAYSDAMLLPGLIGTPLMVSGVSPVVVYNGLVLASFVAAGVAMYALIRNLTGSAAAAAIAGLIFAFQPYRFAHYAQLELLWTCWIPLALLALHKLISTHSLKAGVLLGVCVSLQAWSSLYYAVFVVTAVVIITPILVIRRPRRELTSLAAPVMAALVLTVVFCGPYALPYTRTHEIHRGRTNQDVRDWSPTIENYLSTPSENWLYPYRDTRVGPIEGTLFPGLVAVVLTTVALTGRVGRRELAYAVLLVVAFDLSLGLNGFLFPTIRSVVTPFYGLRVPARMFVIVSACLAVLAAHGVVRLERIWRSGSLAVLFGAAIVLESLSIPVALRTVPEPSRIYGWLALQPTSTILEWPIPRPDALGLTREPEYMYYSTRHWQKLMNGYSGHYPPSYLELTEVLREFPTPQSIDYLRRRNVHYMILHSQPAPERYAELVRQLRGIEDFEFLMTDPDRADEITVFRARSN